MAGAFALGVLVGLIGAVIVVAVVDPGPGRPWRPAGVTSNDRGFRMAPPIAGIDPGEQVNVNESSLESEPAIWVSVRDHKGPTIGVEIPVNGARELGQQLMWLSLNHWQKTPRDRS